jgi:hypothetical protein
VTASSDIKTTSGVLKVDTPSQGAITFNSDSTPVEEGDDFGITVIRPAAGNAIFYWDEGDDVWQFNNAGNVRIQNSLIVDNDAAGAITISEGSITSGSGAISFGDENLTTTGKTTTATFEATSTSEFKGAVTLSNVGLTINNAAPSAVFAVTNAGVATIAGLLNANGGIAVDTNKFTVADGSGNTSIAGTLTLTSTAGTTDFSIVNNGNEVFGVDATNGNTSLDGTLGVGDLATLGSLSVTGTSTLNDDVTIATTKTLTLNQGVVNAAADVDAYVYVDRGTNTDTFIRWDEGVDRWMLSNNGTNAYNILHSNDTLLTLTTNSGAGNSYGFSQGVNNTISILGTTAVDNRGIEILNTNGAVTIGFTSTVRVPSDLTVSSALTTSSLEVTGDALISAASIRLKDKLLFMGYQNTSETNDIGFYSLYKYNDGVDVVNRYAGLVYQPVNGPTTGVWKLFDQDSGSSGGTGETD